jgi:hypothetical protein
MAGALTRLFESRKAQRFVEPNAAPYVFFQKFAKIVKNRLKTAKSLFKFATFGGFSLY